MEKSFLLSLNDTVIRKKYIVTKINDSKLKDRLSDFGFICGAIIEPLFFNIFKDSRAYKINETIIAIRNKDASNIFVAEITGDYLEK